jgi:lysophospholipase L1-like esterase
MRLPLRLTAAFGVLALLLLGAGCNSVRAKVLPPLSPADRWANDIGAFDAQDATNAPPRRPIVFTGSSYIRLWQELPQDYPGLRVMNRGFGGSQLSDVLEHFGRLILRYQPRQVVIYCGSNDIAAKRSVETVVADLRAVVNRIHRELPRARVAFISIALNPARWEQRDAVRAANAAVAEFMAQDPRRQFIDVTTAMLGPDGQPKPDIFVADRRHMNRKGYELWVPLVRVALAK